MKKYIIAQDGESCFHIVTSRNADEAVCFAASELQRYIQLSTCTAIPYFSDGCDRRGPEIRLGEGVRGHYSDLEKMSDEGFLICGDGDDLVITGKTGRAVLYGVYRFLEIYCDFVCVARGIESYKTQNSLIVEDMNICENPAFSYREAFFRNAFDGDFCAKNRLNSNMGDISRARGGNVKWFKFSHSFRELVAPEQYFSEHPEYFSECDGKRISNGQLCLSNPEVARIAKQSLRRWIKDNPECRIFSVAQNDNPQKCTCSACRAVEEEEGSPAGNVIRFVNALADDIKEDYPHIQLHTFAYRYTLKAPRFARPRPNVIVRLCDITCRFGKPIADYALQDPQGEEAQFVNALKEWSDICGNIHVWDYAVNFRNYLQPFFHFHTMAENIRFFLKKGVTGVLEQGNFAYGGGQPADDMKSYLIGRLLWNPNADVDECMDGFIRLVFGEASYLPMKRYYKIMEDACTNSPLDIYQSTDAQYLNDGLIEEGAKCFDEALRLAKSPAYRRRIEREQLSVRYLQLSRMPLDTPGRSDMIDEFFRDVKSHGITEIRERRSLALTRDAMKRSRYTKEYKDEYSLHYVLH